MSNKVSSFVCRNTKKVKDFITNYDVKDKVTTALFVAAFPFVLAIACWSVVYEWLKEEITG
jgi:hypothetical protein